MNLKPFSMSRLLAMAALLLPGVQGSAQPQWNTSGFNSGSPTFGTSGYYPIRFHTTTTERMKLNHTLSYDVDGYAGDRSGYLLLGHNTAGSNIYSTSRGAFSLLHLNGAGTQLNPFGFRPWMHTGITFTGNRDFSYIGLRPVGTDEDITETTIAWSDNGPGTSGPDEMVFRYMGGGGGNTAFSSDLQSSADLDGMHVARFTYDGRMGLGNTFGINTPQSAAVVYARPQSLLHMSLDGNRAVWSQYTNQSSGELATDGLRIGIVSGNAYIYQQENAPLIFSTNATTDAQLARERMRLTHTAAPGNLTRLGISLDPGAPITTPHSLVHMGASATIAQGARSWMNVGTLTAFGSDNMYVGLKSEGTDRQDAVISWGDNQVNATGNAGPDNLRFIFTRAPSSPGTASSGTDNGQEVARFIPACPTCPVDVASMGIGDFSPASANGPGNAGYIGATLDVNGDARIRNVTNDNTLSQVLVRDPDDRGRLHWRDAATLTGGVGTGNNGLSNAGGTLQLGGDCSNATAAGLQNNREIPFNKFSILFSGQHIDGARIGIGTTGCTPGAKLDVLQAMGENQVTINAVNSAGLANTGDAIGVKGTTSFTTAACEGRAIGGAFTASTNARNFGVYGEATGVADASCNPVNYGGYFVAHGANGGNTGIYAEAPAGTGNWAAYINGDGFIPGGIWNGSDERLKTGVRPIEGAGDLLAKLNPVTYTFDKTATPRLNLPQGQQYGVLAQELQKVLPALTKEVSVKQGPAKDNGPESILAVNYTGLIPVLIAAFQEQRERIDRLEAQLQSCCQAQGGRGEAAAVPVVTVSLDNKNEPALGQNVPNPFDRETRIPVYLPSNTAKAEILFYSNDGKVMHTVSLKDRGQISVQVNAATLAAGIYSYTLFADGRPVETRKMLRQ